MVLLSLFFLSIWDETDHPYYAIWWGKECKQWWIGNITDKGQCKGAFQLDSKTDDDGKCIEDLNDNDEERSTGPCMLKATDDKFENLGMIQQNGGCGSPQWKGDNYCDDDNNNEKCEYDGGDCCGDNVKEDYCSICQCLDPNENQGNGGNTEGKVDKINLKFLFGGEKFNIHINWSLVLIYVFIKIHFFFIYILF